MPSRVRSSLFFLAAFIAIPAVGVGAMLIFLEVDRYQSARRFPFHHSGGPGKASIYTILDGEGGLAKHDVCVVRDETGSRHWARSWTGDPALIEQALENPSIFYESDPGSGVHAFCARAVTDSDLAKRVAADMLARCSESSSLRSLLFPWAPDDLDEPSQMLQFSSEEGPDACQPPPQGTVRAKTRRLSGQ